MQDYNANTGAVGSRKSDSRSFSVTYGLLNSQGQPGLTENLLPKKIIIARHRELP